MLRLCASKVPGAGRADFHLSSKASSQSSVWLLRRGRISDRPAPNGGAPSCNTLCKISLYCKRKRCCASFSFVGSSSRVQPHSSVPIPELLAGHQHFNSIALPV